MSSIDNKSDLRSRRTQYTLPFFADSQSTEAFPIRVSAANERAHKLLEAWCDEIRDEPGQGIIVTGPEGSGKTFSVCAVGAGLDARYITGDQLEAALSELDNSPIIIVDDVDQINDPALLMRFINVAQDRRVSFVLAGQGKPDAWAQTSEGPFKDLHTRLAAMPEASLDSPDEVLMSQVLRDWLQARQISLSENLAAFAVSRFKRSFRSLQVFADQLDAEAMHHQKSIDKSLILSVLEQLPEHTLS